MLIKKSIYLYTFKRSSSNDIMTKNLIVASTSTVHGQEYLEYLMPILKDHFKGVKELLFIPYARPGGITHESYTSIVSKAFAQIDLKIKGIHEYLDPVEALTNAQAIFTGGGNTFLLVQMLYKNQVMNALRQAIFTGTPFLGTSAGSNICGLTMQTTNDMPIIHPPSFKTLGILPFNINPHYLDPVEGTKHMGETRETRIREFHKKNTIPVVGIREGSWLSVKNDSIKIKGPFSARIFECNKKPYELNSEEEIVF